MAVQKKTELEDKVDDEDEGSYYELTPQPDDKRKQVFGEEGIVKENGSHYKRDYEEDSLNQIRSEKGADERRESVYASRAKYDELDKDKERSANLKQKRQLKYDTPLDVPTDDSKSGRAMSKYAAVEAGRSPEKTLRKAHIDFILGEADKAGVHSPNRRERLKNLARDYLLNQPRRLMSPIYRRSQNIHNQNTLDSLSKGDQVVLYFGGYDHRAVREGLEKAGTKYIAPMKDGVFGLGPGYHVGLDKKTGAQAVKKWAQKIYETTGRKPKVVGFGEGGSKHVLSAIKENELKKIAETNVVGAVNKSPNEKVAGYVNIFGTGNKTQRAAYNPRARRNVEIKNATGLDLAYNKAGEIINAIHRPKYSKK